MRVFLVTGVTGAGKSSVARRLRECGRRAVSLDADPRLCCWTTADGRPVPRPDEPDGAWLAAHRWTWRETRLDELVADGRRPGDGVLWLCGYAANAASLADRFDAVFLLDIDRDTMVGRLRDRPGGNDFGHVGATLAAADGYYAEFVEQWRHRDATVVDASRPLDAVVTDLLLAAADVGRPGGTVAGPPAR